MVLPFDVDHEPGVVGKTAPPEQLAQTADYYISPVVETASRIGQSMGGTVQSSPYGAGIIAAG